jgi:hypothetical protein
MENNRARRYKFKRKKFRWIGPKLSKEDCEIPNAALLREYQCSRKRGRPKNSRRKSVIK